MKEGFFMEKKYVVAKICLEGKTITNLRVWTPSSGGGIEI